MHRLSVAVAVASIALVAAGCGGTHHANVSMRPGGSLASGPAGAGTCGNVHWNKRTHHATVTRIECSGYHPVPVEKPAAPYAYELPIDPTHPHQGQWSTLVRTHPVTVGYRVRDVFPREWVVIAVQPLPQDGQTAAVRGWRGKQNPIWHGRLVLRLAD
jgi:hypothetical protein